MWSLRDHLVKNSRFAKGGFFVLKNQRKNITQNKVLKNLIIHLMAMVRALQKIFKIAQPFLP
jgi:hypothetical protein